jgi:hypothetical protein
MPEEWYSERQAPAVWRKQCPDVKSRQHAWFIKSSLVTSPLLDDAWSHDIHVANVDENSTSDLLHDEHGAAHGSK